MSAQIEMRIQKIIEEAKARKTREVKKAMRTNWHGNTAASEATFTLIKRLFEETIQLTKKMEAQLKTGTGDPEKWATVIQSELDYLSNTVERETTYELKIAHLQGLGNIIDHHTNEVNNASPGEVAAILDNIAVQAIAVSQLLDDLTRDVYAYHLIAEAFITGEASRNIPNAFSNKLPNSKTAEKLMTLLKVKGVKGADFLKAKKFFEKATKWLGVAQIGFAVTTIFFETLAKDNKWAETLTTGVVAAGASFALGTVITGTAMASVISASLAAAGVTAEVPPLAAAIIAAGLVIVATMAVAALFESLIDLIFDLGDIPKSMRLSISASTYSRMSAGMSSSMAASMVSLPR